MAGQAAGWLNPQLLEQARRRVLQLRKVLHPKWEKVATPCLLAQKYVMLVSLMGRVLEKSLLLCRLYNPNSWLKRVALFPRTRKLIRILWKISHLNSRIYLLQLETRVHPSNLLPLQQASSKEWSLPTLPQTRLEIHISPISSTKLWPSLASISAVRIIHQCMLIRCSNP